jgi:hypothetical protein
MMERVREVGTRLITYVEFIKEKEVQILAYISQ